MYIETVLDHDEVKRRVKVMREHENHHVLKDTALYLFYKATFAFMMDNGLPVSMTATTFGRKARNVWTPYANRYGSFTLPAYRQRGYAKEMFQHSVEQALQAGCVRIKSLTGSAAELSLHRALGNHCWGLTENNEVRMDSPIGPGPFPDEAPPGVPMSRRMTDQEIVEQIAKGLRYDHK